MDARILIDFDGVPYVSILTEDARTWFKHYYHASFAINERVNDSKPVAFFGESPEVLYETMEDAGLSVTMNRTHHW